MRYILLVLMLLVDAAPAFAAPFVYSDGYTAPAVIPDTFRVAIDGGAEVAVVPWSGTLPDASTRVNALRFDVGTVAVGAHSVLVRACKAATLWDPEACSAPSPFSFVRPAAGVAPGVPGGMSLSR